MLELLGVEMSEETKKKAVDPDKLLTRGGGSVVIGLVLWIASSMAAIREEVTEVKSSLVRVTTELEVVSPKDLRQDMENLPTKEDVASIVAASAPWARERAEWMAWRAKIDSTIRQLEKR